jgi:hypothetical protein
MKPSSNFEGLRGQLQSVFRILAKPDSNRWEEAIKLRQDVSCIWGRQAAEGKWFPWPTTIASPGARRLKGVNWRDKGMLSLLEYRVGETNPTPDDIRWCILQFVFECHLPPMEDAINNLDWGMPQTAQRLKKLANSLAAFTRNAKRQNTVSLATAIDDWEHDLGLLHEKYYLQFFHFGWPATDILH